MFLYFRFAINLTCGKTSNSDVALHFNPRLSPKYIVRNSRVKGWWGHEETSSITKFDIPRGKRIAVDILISEAHFFISINGKHYCAYTYRMPISEVNSLEVNGPILVEEVNYRNVAAFPDNQDLSTATYLIPLADRSIHDACKCDQDFKLVCLL